MIQLAASPQRLSTLHCFMWNTRHIVTTPGQGNLVKHIIALTSAYNFPAMLIQPYTLRKTNDHYQLQNKSESCFA